MKLELPIAYDWESWNSFNTTNLSLYEFNELAYTFMDYIEKNGIPKSIHCRNPYVREALKDSCEKLNIELTYDTFPDIQPDLKYMN